MNIEGEDITIQVTEIRKAIKELKNGRSPGDIPVELITSGSQKFFETVTWCINKFINGSPVPDEWKTAYISSIHKKGDKLKCENCRGISVTSTFSRLYGRIIRDRIEKEYKDQEEEEQSGFRTGRSCTYNIFCLKQLIE
ncbi:uncharacterized protein [Diabrotica undecimpunctata]|uniref:uncharacterized protein n=1 Tax=Diabrotica undecimpunctata TaxID=50387 RepID=UPI003B631B15